MQVVYELSEDDIKEAICARAKTLRSRVYEINPENVRLKARANGSHDGVPLGHVITATVTFQEPS